VQPEQSSVDKLFNVSRNADFSSMLVELGAFTTGYPGYLVHRGQSLREVGSKVPMIDTMGNALVGSARIVPDPVLSALGLEWSLVQNQRELTRRGIVGALIVRAGLLVRILDRSFRHLQDRESGGQKTLQHQLVKASFVEGFDQAERIRLEAVSLLDETVAIEFDRLHRALSGATMKAAKLMGGHGFLLGEANTLEFLSLCLTALYRRADTEPQNVLDVPIANEERRQCVA
jgi:hypothetical protein